ncbi:MAG: hypothetical protein FT714_17405, partial [Pantoea sp. Pent]|nr:hypothetical protein [Pantoea sp. Pent]
HSRPYHPQTQGKLERPHEALEMAVPASRYQPSSRQHSARVAPASNSRRWRFARLTKERSAYWLYIQYIRVRVFSPAGT